MFVFRITVGLCGTDGKETTTMMLVATEYRPFHSILLNKYHGNLVSIIRSDISFPFDPSRVDLKPMSYKSFITVRGP